MNDVASKLSVIAGLFQYWLDWQEKQYLSEGIVTDDETYFRQLPEYPTRGTIKAWIEALKEGNQHLEDQKKSD